MLSTVTDSSPLVFQSAGSSRSTLFVASVIRALCINFKHRIPNGWYTCLIISTIYNTIFVLPIQLTHLCQP